MRFEWDAAKELLNRRKHGVSFAEAASVFDDPFAGVRDDPDHSEGEQREIIVGTSILGRMLLVSFTQDGEIIRVISAREATRRERKHYEEEGDRRRS